jgi:hypothetical protein
VRSTAVRFARFVVEVTRRASLDGLRGESIRKNMDARFID